jgi:hypothetical protein
MADKHTVRATTIDGTWVLAFPGALVADIEPDLLAAAAASGQPLDVLERVGLVRYAGSFPTVRAALEAV